MMRVVRLLVLALLLAAPAGVILPATMAVAQEKAEAPDYEAWERTATRAENAIEAGRASTVALEELRAELVTWRDRFGEARSANQSSINTVNAQLETLGPVPESGEEPAEIAAERNALKERLTTLQAPVRTAELAYSRADGLIKGIDRIIRERQTEELLELGPSPLNPVHWGTGVSALNGSLSSLAGEVALAWKNPAQREETRNNLPETIVLALIGLVLVLRGRHWARGLSRATLAKDPTAGRWVIAFVLSLGAVALPFAGYVALTEAAYATGLVGLKGAQLLDGLAPAILVFLVARWLALRIFPARDIEGPTLALSPAQRASGRFIGMALGGLVALFLILSDMADVDSWSEAARNVVLFPLLVLAGLLLVRLSRLLSVAKSGNHEEQEEETFRTRLIRTLARTILVLGILAPVLGAVGYFSAAAFLIVPSLLSLELLAGLLILQRFVTHLYALVTGNKEDADDSLVPIFAGFLLVLLSVPFFALIWGARVADLTELWTRFTQGVSIGGTRISPMAFLTFALVFIVGYMATRLIQGALKNTVLPKTRMDPGGQNAIVSGVGYVGVFLAAIIAITSAGIDMSSLAIVAGALSVGIGFGLQNIVSNFVSGIILLIERPISEGDWIEVGGKQGYVRDISVRSTRIETFDRTDVIVPNADFVSGTVTNYTRGNTVGRAIVPVGVAYGTDTRKVEKILLEIAEAEPMVLAEPAPNVVFQSFGADSLNFEIRAILRDVNWVTKVKSEMNHEIARRFAEEGIEIPFAQRDIWLRNPEALTGGAGRAEPTGEPEATAEPKGNGETDIDEVGT